MKKIKLYLLLGFLTFVFLFSLFPVFVPSVSAYTIPEPFNDYVVGNGYLLFGFAPPSSYSDYYPVIANSSISSSTCTLTIDGVDTSGVSMDYVYFHGEPGHPEYVSQVQFSGLSEFYGHTSFFGKGASVSFSGITEDGYTFSGSFSGVFGSELYAGSAYYFLYDLPPAVDLTFLDYNCLTNVARFSVDDVSCDISGSGFTSVVSSLVPDENKVLFYSYDSTSKILTVNFANDTPNGQTALLYDVQTTEGLFQGSCVFDLQCVSGGDVMYRVDVVTLGGYDVLGNAEAIFKVLKSTDGGISYTQLSTISYDVEFSQTADGGTDTFSSQDKGTYYYLTTQAVDGYDIFHYVVDVDNVTLEGDFRFDIGSITIFDDTGTEVGGTPTDIVDILQEILDFIRQAWDTILALISLMGAFLGVAANFVVFLGNAMVSLFKVITNVLVAFITVVFDYSYSYVSLQSLFSGTLSGSVSIPGGFSLPAFSDTTFLALDNALEYIVENFIHGYTVIWSCIAIWVFVSKHIFISSSVDEAHKETTIGGGD